MNLRYSIFKERGLYVVIAVDQDTRQAHPYACVCSSLAEAREGPRSLGCKRYNKIPGDDPLLVELWA